MKIKDILKSIVRVHAERGAEAESRELELRACHARINLLQSTLCNVMEILSKRSNLDEDARKLFSETVRILREGSPSKDLSRLSARVDFCGDQTMAEIQRIATMIDRLPDE